jgi:photosystem II stability/assembly factor-like uncharacterized protein
VLRRGTWLALAGLLAGVAAIGAAATSENAGLDPRRPASWDLPHPDLYGVDAKGDHVWAVGYWGTIEVSSDGGQSWTRSPTPLDKTLYAVSFADEKSGWVVGATGTVLRSTDGGASWTEQTVSVSDESGSHPLDTHLFGVAAVSPTEAWAVGDMGIVIHTRDGEHWEQLALPKGAFADEYTSERILNAVRFSSPTEGLITGEFATALRTQDGGATWHGERQLVGTEPDVYLFDAADVGGGKAVVTGLAGTLLLTTDGGATWNPHPVPTGVGVFGVAWNGDRGVAAGDRGELYTTQDGGNTWINPKRPHLFNWLRGVSFASQSRVFAVGEKGLILRSDDGGSNWVMASGDSPVPMSGISVPERGKSTEPGRRDQPEKTEAK